MQEEDCARYDKEINQLLTKGFFVNSDGVKSTELEVKKKRKVKTEEEKQQEIDLKEAYKLYKLDHYQSVLAELPDGSKKDANQLCKDYFDDLKPAKKKKYL